MAFDDASRTSIASVMVIPTPAAAPSAAAITGLFMASTRRLTRTLLGIDFTSRDVAAVVAALCTNRFRAPTGAMIAIDGGNERII